jgi:hypothetical protein
MSVQEMTSRDRKMEKRWWCSLKSTGLEIRSDLWETVGRPSKLKVGDAVFYGAPPISYFVEDVDYTARTADVKTTASPVVSHQNVAWSELILLDESQNAVRIVRETTEKPS